MTQKQKGYVGLGVMLALGVGTVFGSDSLYKAIDVMSREKVDYTPGTYVGSAQGFGGEVVATVTVGAAGIESVDLAGAGETPGIGAAALEQLPAAFVESNSSVVDAVAGATISSQAAMDAVQQALDQASGKIDVIEREAAPEAETEAEKKEPAADVNYAPGTYEGSAKGFGGDVTATVVIGDAGIESVELKGDGETPELGGEALKKLGPAFVEAGSADVDAVAGCTVSSQAAMKAVQAALDQAAGSEAADEKKDDADAGKSSAPVSLKPGTYEGSAKGFGGDVTATVVVGDKGIESVELKGDGETPELGGEALKKLGPAFVEAGSADVDGVAGCTVTSEAAKKAVAAALEGAEGGEAAQASAQSDSGSLKAGTYEGSAKGFGGDVTATVVVGDKGIESVELKGDGETPELGGEALKKLGPAFVETGSADVDGVAGCTVTSEAAKKAVAAALESAKGGDGAQAGAQSDSASFKPGTYEGSAKGFGGDVTATVVVGDTGIESVELNGSGETPELGGEALKKLGPAFAEAGSADVDGVAGCTVTSEAAKKAVQAALDQAK